MQGQADSDRDIISHIKNALRIQNEDSVPGLWAMQLIMELNSCDWSARHQDVLRLTDLLEAARDGMTCEVPVLLPLQLLMPAALALDCAHAAAMHLQARLPSLTWIAQHQKNDSLLPFPAPTGPYSRSEKGNSQLLKITFFSGENFIDDSAIGHGLCGILASHRRNFTRASCVSLAPHSGGADAAKRGCGCDEELRVEREGLEAAAGLLQAAAADIAVHLGGSADELGAMGLALRTAPLQVGTS
jgi:hypothetical protein